MIGDVSNHSYYDIELDAYINVVFIQMDTKVDEEIELNEDGSYVIFLNTKCSSDEQMDAFQHAREHIRRGDWQKHSVQQIEAEIGNISVPESEKKESEARKQLNEFYRKMRERKERLAKKGKKEVVVLVDGVYGEPVLKKIVVSIEFDDRYL